MATYVVSIVKSVKANVGDYMALARTSIEHYGGRYLFSSPHVKVLEGGDQPARVVVVEFPSMSVAEAWYASQEYAPARKLSRSVLERTLLLVEAG